MLAVVNDSEVLWRSWTPVQKAHVEEDDDLPSDATARLVKGVASTGGEDQQGEEVLQDGLDWSPLMTKGFINWNHASISDPAAVIGEPYRAGLDAQRRFFLKGFLYDGPGMGMADSAWALLDYLNSRPNSRRRLGWSIEGSGLRKGNLVVRTIIRHVALTHDPVNGDSFASVVKAMCCGLDKCELTPLSKALSTMSSGPLLLENLDGGRTYDLLRQLFFGRTNNYENIFKQHGDGKVEYRQGALSVYDQLVGHGINPVDAAQFLRDLKSANLIGGKR